MNSTQYLISLVSIQEECLRKIIQSIVICLDMIIFSIKFRIFFYVKESDNHSIQLAIIFLQ